MFDNDPILAQAVVDLDNGFNQEYFTGPNGYNGSKNSVLLSLMERAKIHETSPALVYATIKTGRMVTEQNYKLLAKADVREWKKYVREYNRKKAGSNG